MASSSAPVELASTLQSASLNRHPSPTHDLNPSTAASGKQPVALSPTASIATDEVPASALRPIPRRGALPPLPDLRFEQSYLKSLEGTTGWAGVGWVTARDQVLLPLVQGLLWTLVLAGWRHWNRGAARSGRGVGARIRRWWWRVNDWEVEAPGAAREKALVEEVRQHTFHP